MKDPTGRIAPILVVPDVHKALQTYTRVFGFERLHYFDGNDECVALDRCGAQIHLMKGAKAKPESSPRHTRGRRVRLGR